MVDFYPCLQIHLLGAAITFTCIGLAATDTTLHETSILDGSLIPFVQSYFVEAQRMYMFQSDEVLPGTIAGAYDQHGFCYTALAISTTALHMIVAIPEFFIHHVLVEVFVLLSATALRSSMKEFLAYARKNGGSGEASDMEQILTQYEVLKSLVRAVNGITGVFFLCVISTSIPFYVLWAANSYFNIHNSIHFFIYFGLFFILLAIAADMHAKVGQRSRCNSAGFSSIYQPDGFFVLGWTLLQWDLYRRPRRQDSSIENDGSLDGHEFESNRTTGRRRFYNDV